MPRGGKRTGVQGKAYSNRSDLNAGPRIDAPRGQPYGVAGQQIAAQQQMPMAAPPAPAPPVALGAPTTRPDEPVQAGLSLGPGPGPESIPAIAPSGPDPDLLTFAPYLPGLELMSSLPTASSATRNFVRRLRGAIPPEVAQ